MGKESSRLQTVQQEEKSIREETRKKISELGNHANSLYTSLIAIQALFDCIYNMPTEYMRRYERLKAISTNWKQQSRKIELEYKNGENQTVWQGSDAMGATTALGVASTGMFALIRATTSATWTGLGGGALATGVGEMTVGRILSSLAGPIGWTIMGVEIVSCGIKFYKSLKDKDRLEKISALISERNVKLCKLAIIEIDERIRRIDNEAENLADAISKIKNLIKIFGANYSKMPENKQYELGAYVNLMEASTMLLVNPILGLQPKYSEQNFKKLCESEQDISSRNYFLNHESMILSLANSLYKITLDEEDKEVIAKVLKKDKVFLEAVQMSEDEFDKHAIDMVERFLSYEL